MTREEARNMLVAKMICLTRETSGTDEECISHNCENCGLNYEQGNMGEQKEALKMAIKSLEAEPCEDCISREEAKNLFWNGTEGYDYRGFTRMEIGEMLDDLPSVTPTRPKGEWIWKEGIRHIDFCQCSLCGRGQWEMEFDYCPYCGADMRGGAE